jgi:hypothetical protein
MRTSRFNWPIWVAFPLSVVTLFSYPFVFVNWPITRDVPWVNLLLLGLTLALAAAGLRRAFAPGRRWFSRSIASILAVLSAGVLWMFVYGVLIVPRQLPASEGAPQVGQQAPAFTLVDSDHQPVTLSQLLSEPIPSESGGPRPPRGVLLIFYRGYW